jgi:pimeloyl-ACP methyl ester carboxylesterase
MKKQLLVLLGLFLYLTPVFSQKTEFVKSFDDVSIAYHVIGEGNMTLVFIHGWCCDKSYWEHQVDALKADYKIVAVDLAGHGESGLERQDFTMQNFARDVNSVVSHLDLKNVIYIGHSMGVNVMLEAAKLDLNNTRAIFSIDGWWEIPEVKTKSELEDLELEQRKSWDITGFQIQVYDQVKSWYHPDSESTIIEHIAKDMSSNDPRAGIESYINILQYYYKDYPTSLKKIGDLPVIAISSTSNPNEEEFRKYGVNFTDIRIKGPSHFLQLTCPEEFNKIFLEQLQDLE